MPTDTYSIVDLARLTGVNVRTIRYYLAQGLLRASGESGPGAHYGEGHLDRLRLTRRLQQQHLPLAEIRRRLAELTDSDVASVLATTMEPEPGPTTSALDYVRTVLGAPTVTPSMAQAVPGVAPRATRPSLAAAKSMFLSRSAMVAETPLASLAEAQPTETDEPPGPERSQWERLSLGPNVEIHIRRPLSRLEQRRVERLLTIARQVLKEETP